ADLSAVTAECLIDRVIDDLPETVHEAAGIGGTDIHTGALAYRLETLEHREMSGRVVRAGHCGLRSCALARCAKVLCGRAALKPSQRMHPLGTPTPMRGPAYALSEIRALCARQSCSACLDRD